jgi:hypothetical protein
MEEYVMAHLSVEALVRDGFTCAAEEYNKRVMRLRAAFTNLPADLIAEFIVEQCVEQCVDHV